MTRAAIYRRISTSGQEDGSSLDVQERVCTDYAEGRGYEVADVYTDVHSGADLWNRPELQRMIDDAVGGRFEVIVVAHSDRLSREPDHQSFIKVQLQRHGVRVESVTNPRTESFEDQLMGSFEALFAKHERVRIQKRMATGRMDRIHKGKLQPGGHALFGYRYDDPGKSAKGCYVENPEQSWIVQRIFREAVEGKPLRRIALDLNAEGIRTAKGSDWQARQVSRMLSNPAYKGLAYANRYTFIKGEDGKRKREVIRPEEEWILIPDAAPPLVTAEVWRRANDRLATNRVEFTRPYDEATDALLRAGFVYCDHCGSRMTVQRRRGHIYYKCQTTYYKRSSECRGWAIEATKLDEFVWGYCSTWIRDPGVLVYEARRTRPRIEEAMQEDLTGFDKGLAATESEQRNLAKRLGLVDDAAAEPLMARLAELGILRTALLAERQEAEGRIENAKLADRVLTDVWEEAAHYMEQVPEWTYDYRRELLRRLGLRVTVHKKGAGRAAFWMDIAPPWPEGVVWFDFAYKQQPGPYETDKSGVHALSKSVYAAYQRTQTLAVEQERKLDGP